MILPLRQLMTRSVARYRRSKLLKSGSWYMAGTFAQRGLAFIGVYLFTRLLTDDEYGTVVLFGSWMAMLFPIVTLNVSASVQVARYDFEEAAYRDFLSAITGLGVLMSGLFALLLLILPADFLQRLTSLEKGVLVLLALNSVVQIPMTIMLNVWRMDFRYVRYTVVTIGFAFLRLILPALLIVIPFLALDAPLRYIVGFITATVIVSVYAGVQMLKASRRLINVSAWRYAAAYSVPIIPHVLTGIVLSHFDRILIDRYIGRSETGLYTLAYQIGELVSMIWFASNTAWSPWFYEQVAKEHYAQIHKRARQYVIAFTVLVLLTIFSAPLLIWLIAPPDYRVAGAAVPVVMAGLFFNLPYSLYSNVEFLRKKTVYVSVGTALAAIINVVLNIWLLPRYGYMVAAWTTLFSYICLFVFHAGIVRFILKDPIRLPFGWMLACSACIMVTATGMYVLLI